MGYSRLRIQGEAAWRSVLTMGGVIFDGDDIAAIIAAIGSGLPVRYGSLSQYAVQLHAVGYNGLCWLCL